MTKHIQWNGTLSQEGYDILKGEGGCIVCPTKVGYIIMTSDKAGLERKFEAKERNRNKPGVVLCGSMDELRALAQLNPEIEAFYQKHWDEDILLGCILPWKPEAFEKLKAEGYTRVAVVSLDVIPGMEYLYDSIVTKQYAQDFKEISLATPLMYFQGTEGEPDQVVDFLNALSTQFPKNGPEDAVLLMAHGTPHPANAYYSVIQDRIHELGLNNVYVYSVEGRPNLDDVIPHLKRKGIKHVTLMPIMMVAGDHANNDMAGSEPDSHKSLLEAEGLTVDTYLHGLGENAAIRDIYVDRANEAVAALK